MRTVFATSFDTMSMILSHKRLNELDLFKGLTCAELEIVASVMTLQPVQQGDILTRSGSLADQLYIIISGVYMIYFRQGRAFTLQNKGSLIGRFDSRGPLTVATFMYTSIALTDGQVLALTAQKAATLLDAESAIESRLVRNYRQLYKKQMSLFGIVVKESRESAPKR